MRRFIVWWIGGIFLLALAWGVSLARAAEPSSTLAEDLASTKVPLVPGYAQAAHPRLLFTAADRAALQQKAKNNPELWNAVLASAKRLGPAPSAAIIKSGAKYWQIERVESGALAYFVTGDKKHLDDTLRWMIPHCAAPIWGTGFRDNLDLQASWYLYHLSIAYDILHDDIPKADQKIIRDGLAAHAQALFDSFDPAGTREKFNYDQNHTYIPAVALATASLALLGEVPDAGAWLKRSYAVMQRCRYVLGQDGYYYEGYGYWSYALHWHVRYADVMGRATGQKMLDLPGLAQSWKFALYMMLPGNPGAFDVDDTGKWAGDDRPGVRPNNYEIYWDLAKAAAADGDMATAGADRTVADMYYARWPDQDYPAAAFLWYAPEVPATPLAKITPYDYFSDHDVISWRSGWDAGATCLLFRCGPPEGHAALAELGVMKDWGMNAGHVHPDIGAFYLYAKGAYLAVTTGYTAEKWTRDHNTLLVDGKGQGADGSYWNDRGVAYQAFNEVRIASHYLCDDYAFASGAFGAAYSPQTPEVHLTRTLLATKRYLLVIDDMSAPAAHKLTWLIHTDGPFKAAGESFVAKLPKASLAVFPLLPADLIATPGPTTVMAGSGPGKATPTRRGYQLALAMKEPAKAQRLVNLLVPLGADEAAPTTGAAALNGNSISLQLKWPDGRAESVALNLRWRSGATRDSGPATFTTTAAGGKK